MPTGTKELVLSTINKLKPEMRLILSVLARTSDGFGISDKTAAALPSVTFEDIRIITSQNLSMVINKNKLRKQRQKARLALYAKSKTMDADYIRMVEKTITLIQKVVKNKYH